MTLDPLKLEQITSWFKSKQTELAGSDVSLVAIRETTEFFPAVTADFDGIETTGRISGWVSGLFDFEVVRISDGKDIFFEHAKVSKVGDLEPAYSKFVQAVRASIME